MTYITFNRKHLLLIVHTHTNILYQNMKLYNDKKEEIMI